MEEIRKRSKFVHFSKISTTYLLSLHLSYEFQMNWQKLLIIHKLKRLSLSNLGSVFCKRILSLVCRGTWSRKTRKLY